MSNGTSPRLTGVQWLIIVVACIGFAFDIYELLMLPLIATPALSELLQVPADNPKVLQWIGILQWGSAVCGGIFGLLGGWLIDRYGRKKILVASILIYGFSPVFAAMSTSVYMLLFFRCTTFIGVCVEFVAAVAWLAELFPDKKQREAVLGITQAFSSFGGLMVTGASVLCRQYADSLPMIPVAAPFDGHAFWRYTLITGLIPALPILLLLPWLPESPVWKQKRAAGTLKRASIGELFAPALRRTTITATILFACAYAVAFGAIQLTPPQISRGVPELLEQRKALAPLQAKSKELNAKYDAAKAAGDKEALAAIGKEMGETRKLSGPLLKEFEKVKDNMQFWQEMGGLLGRIALAGLVMIVVSRRMQLWAFLVPSMILVPLTFGYLAFLSEPMLRYGLAACAFLAIAQYSYWGNYLPAAFPMHLRGTAGGFAANVGGRMIGTSAAFVTTNLVAPYMTGPGPFAQVAQAAAIVGGGVVAIGLVTSFFLPEPSNAHDAD